jgi:bisanhydrobacterioruberin hydratase
MKALELLKELKSRSPLFTALVLAYAVMWLGGVGHYVIADRPPLNAPWAASLFLFLAGAVVVWTSARRDWLGLALAAALGFAAEIHGVKYGVIFGPYHYTDVLQPRVWGVPLAMFSAWLVLVAYTRQMLLPLRLADWLKTVLASAWMTALDLVIDPLAAHQLGYWRWEGTGAYYGIPARNFVGWFVVSWLIFTLVRQGWRPNPWACYVGLSITLFFTVIALSYGLWLAGGVGLALCLLHYAIAVFLFSAPPLHSSASRR